MAKHVNSANAFDSSVYSEINERRWEFFVPFIERLKRNFRLVRALDLGAGAGYFSGKLSEIGFVVTAIDGRAENVAAINLRYPQVKTGVVDLQSPGAFADFSANDFLFCAGLLYHLENPVAVMRAIAEHPSTIAFIETQLLPGSGPYFRYVEEGRSVTQGLGYLALIPTRDVLVRMLSIFGRSHVYEIEGGPSHPQFHESSREHQLRRILIASRTEVDMPGLVKLHAEGFGKGFHMKNLSFIRRVWLRLSDR